AFEGDEWTVESPRPFYSWQVWQSKLWLIIGAALCAYAAVNIFAASNLTLSVSLGFLAIFLVMGSFPWLPGPLAPALGLPAQWQPAVTIGLAAVAVLIGFHGQSLVEVNQTTPGLWYFLVAGVAAALACAPRRLSGWAAEPEAEPPRWAEVTLFLSLLALAWIVHIWKIDIFPYAAEGDEAGGGVWAWDILHGNYENPLISSNLPQHFYSITSLFFKLFGLSVGTMRLHAVVFGTLSVASAYLLFRLFSGWAAALLASLLMLFSYWHLHFSRFGHYNMEQIYCQMVAFYFVFKGLRHGRYWHFVAGGVAFGLAMLAHLASRLLPFEGLALVLYLVLTARPSLRRHATGLLAFVVAAWIVSSPALLYWFRASSISFARAGSVSIFDKTNTNAPPDVLAGFVANSKASMLMFNQLGDSRSRDNPLAPDKMLETGTAVLFALAFAYALYHWRQPGRFFLLAVFFLNLSASVFSVEAPQSLRTAGNIPIVFAIIALWLGDLSAGLAAWGRKRAALVFLGIGLPLTLLMCYHSAYKYFVQQAGLCFDVSPTYVGIAVGQVQAQDTVHPTRALLVASGYAATHPPVILFKQGTEMRNHYDLTEYLPPIDIGQKNLMLIFSDDYQQVLPYVESLFPEVAPQVITNTSRIGGPVIATYLRIPIDTLAAHHGLRARALVAGRWIEKDHMGINNSDPAFAGATRIEWEGALRPRH
ncbi:MAG TPA: glycosyltransferase family 39 protein, partial [bacterium]|nr:glycosyltransferase family 39 protein [bacterium]